MLECEIPHDDTNYMAAIDRGGLTWTTDLLLSIVVQCMITFKCLVSSTHANNLNLTQNQCASVQLLTDLCLKFESVVETKRMDVVSRKMKEEAWQTLAAEFNAATTTAIHCELGQLKHVSDTLLLRNESRLVPGLNDSTAQCMA